MLCKIVKGETANMLKEVVGELKAAKRERNGKNDIGEREKRP